MKNFQLVKNEILYKSIFLFFLPCFFGTAIVYLLFSISKNWGFVFYSNFLVSFIPAIFSCFIFYKKQKILMAVVTYFLLYLVIMYLWGYFFKYLGGSFLTSIFFCVFNLIGYAFFYVITKLNTPQNYMKITIFLILISGASFVWGIKYQIDLFNGYCLRTNSFLTEKEKCELVINNQLNNLTSVEREASLNNLSNSCFYTPPVKWGGEAEDHSFKYQLLGAYNGSITLVKKDGIKRSFFIDNCGSIIDEDYLYTGTLLFFNI